jgi:sodium-coupled neutral amino acid transporter 9
LGISILDVDVSLVLSFDGAIIGFFMAYGIPIYMHLKCYHLKLTPQEK